MALLEATKGALVLAAGAGLLALVHHDLQAIGELWVSHLHLNPASRYPRIFLELLGNVRDAQIWLLSLAALGYATVRFIEAYGLWRGRRWAEWFAVLSGGIYIPFELYELGAGISSLKLAALAINLAVVGYMALVLVRLERRRSLPTGKKALPLPRRREPRNLVCKPINSSLDSRLRGNDDSTLRRTFCNSLLRRN